MRFPTLSLLFISTLALAGCSGRDGDGRPVGPDPQPAAPPSIVAWETIPRVLVRGSADPVRLRAFVTGDASAVTFGIRGFATRGLSLTQTLETVALPGGTARIWEVTTTATELLAGFEAPGGANFIGRIGARGTDARDAESQAVTTLVQGDWPEAVTARSRSATVQTTEHVLNVQVGMDGNAIAQFIPTQLAAIAAGALAAGTNPDFLAIVPPVYQASQGSAYYLALRNDTRGIGVQMFDRIAAPPYTDLQSLTRLQGLIVIRDPPKVDLAAPNAVHEVAHRFTAYLDAVYGSPGASGHWPISELAIGVMGYQRGQESERFGYRFERQTDGSHVMRRAAIEKRFNTMELYAMGLLPASAVDSFLVFSDPQSLPAPGDGVRITAPWRYITADSVSRVVGAREPRAGQAPTTFHTVLVVLTRGRLLTPRELAFYDHAAARGESTEPLVPIDVAIRESLGLELPFAAATLGLGRLTTRLIDTGQSRE